MPDLHPDPSAFFFHCGGVASITPCQPPSRYAASVPSAKAQTEDQLRAERILQQPNPATADPMKGTLSARAKGSQPPQFAAKLSAPPARGVLHSIFSPEAIAAVYLARHIDPPKAPPAKPSPARLSAPDIYARRSREIEEGNYV